jgi:hypothetical protein
MKIGLIVPAEKNLQTGKQGKQLNISLASLLFLLS